MKSISACRKSAPPLIFRFNRDRLIPKAFAKSFWLSPYFTISALINGLFIFSPRFL
nr:MAG TPA: hypothetical protein [Caudoviricetes sp.]